MDDDNEQDENPFADHKQHNHPHRNHIQHRNDDDNRWESGFKVDLPDFQGTSYAEELLDLIAGVEELLECKRVPDERRVALVVTRFGGRALAWWQQLKLSRMREGKASIFSWEKLQKQMKQALLPYNYTRTMYNLPKICVKGID